MAIFNVPLGLVSREKREKTLKLRTDAVERTRMTNLALPPLASFWLRRGKSVLFSFPPSPIRHTVTLLSLTSPPPHDVTQSNTTLNSAIPPPPLLSFPHSSPNSLSTKPILQDTPRILTHILRGGLYHPTVFARLHCTRTIGVSTTRSYVGHAYRKKKATYHCPSQN